MYREVVDRLVTTLPGSTSTAIGNSTRQTSGSTTRWGRLWMNNWASSDDEQADDQPETEEEEA